MADYLYSSGFFSKKCRKKSKNIVFKWKVCYNFNDINKMEVYEMENNQKATISTICGIVSLVVGIIGGITFGVIGGAIALVLGIVAIIMGVGAKKETNGAKGSAGMICGILGIVFGALFTLACVACGSETGGYGCYGTIGGPMCAVNDAEDALNDIYGSLY